MARIQSAHRTAVGMKYTSADGLEFWYSRYDEYGWPLSDFGWCEAEGKGEDHSIRWGSGVWQCASVFSLDTFDLVDTWNEKFERFCQKGYKFVAFRDSLCELGFEDAPALFELRFGKRVIVNHRWGYPRRMRRVEVKSSVAESVLGAGIWQWECGYIDERWQDLPLRWQRKVEHIFALRVDNAQLEENLAEELPADVDPENKWSYHIDFVSMTLKDMRPGHRNTWPKGPGMHTKIRRLESKYPCNRHFTLMKFSERHTVFSERQ